MKVNLQISNVTLKRATNLLTQFLGELSLEMLPESFNYTTKTREEVLEIIKQAYFSDITFSVHLYRPVNPWTRAIGYANYSAKKVFINERKISGFTEKDYFTFLVHESMHIFGFKHLTNYRTAYNLKTVPYAVEAVAAAWYDVKKNG